MDEGREKLPVIVSLDILRGASQTPKYQIYENGEVIFSTDDWTDFLTAAGSKLEN